MDDIRSRGAVCAGIDRRWRYQIWPRENDRRRESRYFFRQERGEVWFKLAVLFVVLLICCTGRERASGQKAATSLMDWAEAPGKRAPGLAPIVSRGAKMTK
ncbi:hypothetical protein B0J11DRAFT_509061 [Dendryphion nanum]|uniref:Uncharacterized protein n=1 Tax=Dendryphion nanum TaxID=256645 RepID=A0A9P9DEB6_9PLEO|nr:hypothetical protein B0J11DRAFT_509061 [Dendryphion nanum]